VKVKDFWIFFYPEIFKFHTTGIQGFLDFFSKKHFLSPIITLIKIKDFWILFYFLKFLNFNTMELKDFWILAKKEFS